VPPGVRGTPLGKILRQLRIEREEFDLSPQLGSRVAFGAAGEVQLRFTNDFAVLEAEVADRFPGEIDGFRRVAEQVRSGPLAGVAGGSARAFLRQHLREPVLEDLLLCPLLFYGSAREDDMDLGQFQIMFRALYLEGFARPLGGVRVLMRVLLEKYRRAGGERRMKCGVRQVLARGGRAAALVLDSGEEVTADQVLSSVGAAETAYLCGGPREPEGRTLGYVETIAVLDQPPAFLGWGADTIVFFNDSERFSYRNPSGPVDLRSGIICFPNNFDYGPGRTLSEGVFRVTCLADYGSWAGLELEAYRAAKAAWFPRIQAAAQRFLPPVAADTLNFHTVDTDMFTPTTVEHFTGHFRGAIYGSPHKHPDGRTGLSNLFLCGTDQGMLGIVGAMLSGISIANQHLLQPAGASA